MGIFSTFMCRLNTQVSDQLPENVFDLQYTYIDDYRHLIIKFNQDGSLLIRNSNQDLTRTFKGLGEWRLKNKDSIIVFWPPRNTVHFWENVNLDKPIPMAGSRVNWLKYYKENDINQIFPYLFGDIMTFKKRFTFLVYRDFKFKRE